MDKFTIKFVCDLYEFINLIVKFFFDNLHKRKMMRIQISNFHFIKRCL